MTDMQMRILCRVRDRIEQGWTKHALAVDKDSRGVDPEGDRACKWCLTGALMIESDYGTAGGCFTELRCHLQKCANVGSLSEWNDESDTTKEDVLRLIDTAIADLEMA